MSVDDKARRIYDAEIKEVTATPERWKGLLRLAGDLYRYEFDNILLIYGQKPSARLVADYDTWKKVDRYVKRGSKGIAIFPSRALEPHMRYVFDISDTGGRDRVLTWNLGGDTMEKLYDYLMAQDKIQPRENADEIMISEAMKDFTKAEIRSIMEEEFGEQISELRRLSGSVISEYAGSGGFLQPKRKGLPDMEQLAYRSALYEVGTRCGFDLSDEEQDFGQIVNITDEDMVYRLGSLVCDVSCSVLKGFYRNLKSMEQQKEISAERRIAYGTSSADLQGSERTSLPGDRDPGRDERPAEAGEVRKDGDEVSGGDGTPEIQDIAPIRENVREDAGGRGGSQRSDGPADGELSGEEQATESVIHDGDVETQGAGTDDGRGDRAEPDRDEVSLEEQELNRELDEINSFGKKEAGEYHQASFFDPGYSLEGSVAAPRKNPYRNEELEKFEKELAEAKNGVYNYLNPKKADRVPEEYIREVLLRGTGFQNGMTRVCKIFETEIDATTRANLIKKEYGLGGAGWPLDGYGLHGYDTFHGQGMRFQWRDEDGEVEGYVSWKSIEKEIGALILTGEYRPERQKKTAEENHEEVEAIDADFHEITEELDDYAIPDEPESYDSISRNTEQSENTVSDEIKTNFRYDIFDVETGGPKARYQWNVDAITALKKIEAEGRLATPEEQKILSKYVGWGGIPQAFDADNESWRKEYSELKGLLSEEEYNAARATVNVKMRVPMKKVQAVNKFTPQGRSEIHRNLRMDLCTIRKLMGTVDRRKTIQFTDNRISRYVAQGGKCYVTGKILLDGEIYCHHKKEGKKKDDSYGNLIIVHKDIHKLIHAKNQEDINHHFQKYGRYINLEKLNRLRKAINNFEIKENALDNSDAE